MFNLGGQQGNSGGFNLSQTGGGVNQYAGSNGFSLGAQPQQQNMGSMFTQQPQQPNGFMGGIMGGMGMTQQQQMMMQNGQITPPSEMELMAALLESQNPIHRFIATGGLASVIDLVATATSLSLMNILKNATFVMDEDEGAMKLDPTTLPSDLQTLSVENVNMILTNIVSQSQQTVQQAEMQRQQIMAMSQQSMMGGALSAALADEGMMNKVGGGIGSVARGLIGLPTK
tara:strand:+ start:1541 stop:2227 length:687 start_codon:yes stop_codon:yes gene_type:complete